MKEFNHFLKGFGSIINLTPATSKKTLVGNKPDPYKYTYEAWKMTGALMRQTMSQIDQEKDNPNFK
ncbi:hypothetical protein ACFFHK_01105 [Gallibacterium trehalosifermentans]|uniref:Uncharacterized protein n=1 Tax=Gallibacterium trehalosifermentans TaxID=516935 RepID=A0ABV6GYV0_9PAST